MIKKIIKIIIFIIILLPSARLKSFAVVGYVDFDNYNIYGYQFYEGDDIKFFTLANKNFSKYEKSTNKEAKKYYLHEALRYFYLLSKMNKESLDAQIGLGKVYDAMDEDKLAMSHFYNAYNLNSKNAELNYAFGNFYYRRKNYIKAEKLYRAAINDGYSNDLELNIKLAIIYEKLGDLEKAKTYYQKAYKLSNKNKYLNKKIHLLDELNYSDSQYYLFVK